MKASITNILLRTTEQLKFIVTFLQCRLYYRERPIYFNNFSTVLFSNLLFGKSTRISFSVKYLVDDFYLRNLCKKNSFIESFASSDIPLDQNCRYGKSRLQTNFCL